MRTINLLRLTLVLKMCYKNKYYEAAVIDVRDKPGPLHLGEDRLCDMTGAIRNANDGKRLLETTVRFAGNEVLGSIASSLPIVGGVVSFGVDAVFTFIPSIVPQQLVCDGNSYLVKNTNTLVMRYVYLNIKNNWELANSVSYVTAFQNHQLWHIVESSGVTGVKPVKEEENRIVDFQGRYYEAASDAVVDFFTASNTNYPIFPVGRPATKSTSITSRWKNVTTKSYTQEVAFPRYPGQLIAYANPRK